MTSPRPADGPRLLDLFCGAGGAAMGYHRAGFARIVGVDIKPQPHYPFECIQGDALEYVAAHVGEFDAIHASPPCQAYSEATPIWARQNHERMIGAVRTALRRTGRPYVIENVENARRDMQLTIMLCGTMFGLNVWRHRYFEIEPASVFMAPATCNHERRPVVTHAGSNSRRLGPVSPTGTTRRAAGRFEWDVETCRQAMEVPWMTRKGVDQAIPPAYTEYIGLQLMAYLPHAKEMQETGLCATSGEPSSVRSALEGEVSP